MMSIIHFCTRLDVKYNGFAYLKMKGSPSFLDAFFEIFRADMSL
jgi:hypothetical protein